MLKACNFLPHCFPRCRKIHQIMLILHAYFRCLFNSVTGVHKSAQRTNLFVRTTNSFTVV